MKGTPLGIKKRYDYLKSYHFRDLGRLYAVAIFLIVLVLILTQLLIQHHIGLQQQDATVVNIAGRQRMLSQKIAKVALQLQQAKGAEIRTLQQELTAATTLWKESHQKLSSAAYWPDREQNSQKINELFEQLKPYYHKMLEGCALLEGGDTVYWSQGIKNILVNEKGYLGVMDTIVFQYSREAKERVQLLSHTEWILLTVSLIVIAFELFFIFRPTAQLVKDTVVELKNAKEQTDDLLQETEELYQTLGQAYQVLSDREEKEAPLQHVLAKVSLEGEAFWVSPDFRDMMQWETRKPLKIKEWWREEGYEQAFIEQVWGIVKEKGAWHGEVRVTSGEGDFVWLDLHLVKVPYHGIEAVMVMGVDLSDQKEAEALTNEINMEKIEREIDKMRIRSALIMEGQEEERKRISKDIHDGIGQLLTGLKFKLESLSLKNEKKTVEQLGELKKLVQRIIVESRRIAFHLAPSSLTDYGLPAVLNKFAAEVSRLSDYEVTFINRSGFLGRLDPSVETNVYRIVQEAVNNAIKYAKGNHIVVEMEHDSRYLLINVQDDGVGFDKENMPEHKKGLGLLNMEDRTRFVQGTLVFDTAIGQGTKVLLQVPLKKGMG
ncbi:ATP-binding protein [Algivirga pacifica]|uniref:histidine kinase n=1 Tax=Algivirga pacifica TaxID=1162670 RepID=A0ABP9D5T7_9BACT